VKSPFLRFALALALMAVSGYVAFSALPLFLAGTETAKVRYDSVSLTIPVYGVFVREELVLPASANVSAAEAQRVAKSDENPQSGIYTAYLDGFEHLHNVPLTVDAVKNLCQDRRIPLSSPGKIITDSRYRFYAIAETPLADSLDIGLKCTLENDFFGGIELTLAEKGESNGKFTPLLFYGDRDMLSVMYLREVSGRLLLKTVTGLRVPDSAVNEDSEGIYVSYLSLGEEHRAHVQVLFDGEGYKLISSPLLFEGSEVIIRSGGD